jgi:hypothetical protein
MLSLWIEPTFTEGSPTSRTVPIWNYLSKCFKDCPHVLFGIGNEPEYNYDGSLDSKVIDIYNECVKVIRDNGATNIVAVQGTGGWARRMDAWVNNPSHYPNVVYECHPYNAFDVNQWYNPAKTLPVILGEFGPVSEEWATMTNADIRTTVTKANELGVSWLGWALHHKCPPNMLVNNGGTGIGMNLVLSKWGQLITELIKS